MSNFRIGEKVVCVNPIDNLVKNQIYTVRGIYKSVDKITYVLYLHEIIGEYSIIWQKEIGFNENRFRKLDHQFAEDVCAQLIEDAKRETILN